MQTFKQFLESIEDEFIKDIQNNPQDKIQILLIYADWLEEHGKPLAATIMRLFDKEVLKHDLIKTKSGMIDFVRNGNYKIEMSYWTHDYLNTTNYINYYKKGINYIDYNIYDESIYLSIRKDGKYMSDVQESEIPEELIAELINSINANV